MSTATNVRPPRSSHLTNTRELALFAMLVGLFTILADAAVSHALLWQNDPYWTYWVTDTFLLATVFAIGTAWLGVGVGRGALIAVVHTTLLTVYYWTLSPIGLPSHPKWLDFEHTWLTGVPVHFAVMYLGYLTTLWLWRRRPVAERNSARVDALAAVLAAGTIVVVAGLLAALAVGDFPGITWFVVRFFITVPFLLLWWAAAGRDWRAAVSGTIALALMWGAYGHYLSPSGLPDIPLRITTTDPPPADVEWLGYRELWLISVPIYLLVAGAVLSVASRLMSGLRVPVAPVAGVLTLVAAPLLIALPFVDAGGDDARIESRGAAMVERGLWYSGDFADADAELTVVAEDRGGRRTPLPPHDEVSVEARIAHPDGSTYVVLADEPMVEDPLGRHGTWRGVGLDEWHHGESGIGSERLPALRSAVALFAVGDVWRDGQRVAAGVPIHVMTADDGLPGRLELNVGDEATPVIGLPDERLRAVWEDFSGGGQKDPTWARYATGTAMLTILLTLALYANAPGKWRRRERERER